MSYLLDTNVVCETFRRRPEPRVIRLAQVFVHAREIRLSRPFDLWMCADGGG